MAKYNHLLYYPFRNRSLERYDLLKPKSTFFNLLVISSLCIVWMVTIFLSTILQYVYTDVTSVDLVVFILLTVAIAVLSSLLNTFVINRLFRLYVVNVKNAFKVDYGHQFKPVGHEVEEEDSMEEMNDIELEESRMNISL